MSTDNSLVPGRPASGLRSVTAQWADNSFVDREVMSGSKDQGTAGTSGLTTVDQVSARYWKHSAMNTGHSRPLAGALLRPLGTRGPRRLVDFADPGHVLRTRARQTSRFPNPLITSHNVCNAELQTGEMSVFAGFRIDPRPVVGLQVMLGPGGIGCWMLAEDRAFETMCR